MPARSAERSSPSFFAAVVDREAGPRVWEVTRRDLPGGGLSGWCAKRSVGWWASDPSGVVELRGGLTIVGRARLDNRIELRAALGPHRSWQSDLEVVAAVFDRRGEAGLPDLFGDFAFAAWRTTRDSAAVVVRDQLGVQPVFTRGLGDGVAIADCGSLLRSLEPTLDEPDDRTVGDFLLFDVPLDPTATGYRELERVPPGTLLDIRDGGRRLRRYYDLGAVPQVRSGDDEVADLLGGLFDRAVESRCGNHVAGVLFSGGLDSSLVAASLLARDAARPVGLVHAYEHLVDDPALRTAPRSAQELGLSIRVRTIDEDHPWSGPQGILRDVPIPFNEPFFGPTLALVRTGRELGCDVVLTGEGGDELGWSTRGDRLDWALARPWEALTRLTREIAVRRRVPRWGLRRAVLDRARGRTTPSWTPSYPPWIAPELERRLHLRERWEHHVGASRTPGPRAAAVELLSGPWAELVYRWYGRVSELAGATLRHPFLDRRLVEAALGLPPLPWATDRTMMRTMARGRLSERGRTQPKAQFSEDPLGAFLRSVDSAEFLEELSIPEGYVDGERFRSCWKRRAEHDPWVFSRPISLGIWFGDVR